MKFLPLSLLVACAILPIRLTQCAEFELIADPYFARGFQVQATHHPATVEGSLQWDAAAGPPVWTLAQWNSQSTIIGTKPTRLPSGAWQYANEDKQIIVGGGAGSAEADLVLTILGTHEYEGAFRTPGQGFPHLLVSQKINNPGGHLHGQSITLERMTAVRFHLEARLLYDHRTLGAGYKPGQHASQFNLFYTIQNLNRQSSGYGDYLWFGTSIYDDRQDLTGLHIQEDVYTHKLIYNIGIAPFTSQRVADGQWLVLEGDLLPHLRAALREAWKRGYLLQSRKLDDYGIGGMNLGWEMPGLNDASVQIRNYQVVATLQVSSHDSPTQSMDAER